MHCVLTVIRVQLLGGGVRLWGGQLEPFVIKLDSSSFGTARLCPALLRSPLLSDAYQGYRPSTLLKLANLQIIMFAARPTPSTPTPASNHPPHRTLTPRSPLLMMPITRSNNCKNPQSNPQSNAWTQNHNTGLQEQLRIHLLTVWLHAAFD